VTCRARPREKEAEELDNPTSREVDRRAMELDVECLRGATVENLERLAASLGLRLPPKGRDRAYVRKLVQAVKRGIDRDAVRAQNRRGQA
jgi:hypothetical protein